MKTMEYIVGKPKLKTALTYAALCIAWAIALFVANAWQGIRVFVIIMMMIVIIVVIPGIAYSRIMWKVDEQQLCYTYHETFVMKIICFYRHLLIDHHLSYQMRLNLNQIDHIAVTYAAIPRMPFGAYGYDILFEIHTYSGSLYTFDILGFGLDKKDALDAIAYMQKQKMRFVDRYHILDALKKEIPISYYLEKVDKENSHD